MPAASDDAPVERPDCLAFIQGEAWQNLRSDSAVKVLARRGLLEETLGRIIEACDAGGKKGAKLRRLSKWLSSMGVEYGARALDGLIPYALQSRTFLAQEFCRQMGVNPDTPEGLALLMRRQAYELLMHQKASADTITKLSGMLHQRHAEKDKDRGREQGDERLAMQAREYERRIESQQMEGAEFIDAVLAEADRLEHLRALRRDSLASNEPVKERLRKIRAAVWGKQLGDNEEGGQS